MFYNLFQSFIKTLYFYKNINYNFENWHVLCYNFLHIILIHIGSSSL